MDRGQFRIPFNNITGNGTWKGMPIRPLNLCQLFDQLLLLTGTHRHLDLSSEHLAPGIVRPPWWRICACAPRRVELEVLDVLLRQQEDASRLIGWEPTEIDVAVHSFICDTEHLCRLFDRNISRNVWKIFNICHESSLTRDYFPVN